MLFMAREIRDLEQLKATAHELSEIASRVADVVKSMETEGLDSLLIHGAAVANTYLPFIYDWSVKLSADCNIQVRAMKEGRRSRAHIDKARNARQRKKAAK